MTTADLAEQTGARDRERARLARLAGIADRCLNDSWLIDAYGMQRNIVARRSTGEQAVICTIHQAALPDEMDLIAGALENLLMFLELRRRAIATLKERQAARPEPATADENCRLRGPMREGDFAANAAMLCVEPLFHRFLESRDPTRDIHDKDHADAALKALIGIASKKQLNSEREAQAAFLDLRADFNLWKEGGPA